MMRLSLADRDQLAYLVGLATWVVVAWYSLQAIHYTARRDYDFFVVAVKGARHEPAGDRLKIDGPL